MDLVYFSRFLKCVTFDVVCLMLYHCRRTLKITSWESPWSYQAWSLFCFRETSPYNSHQMFQKVKIISCSKIMSHWRLLFHTLSLSYILKNHILIKPAMSTSMHIFYISLYMSQQFTWTVWIHEKVLSKRT